MKSTKQLSQCGFSEFLHGQCTTCEDTHTTYTSSPSSSSSNHFDVNRRMVFSFLNCGLGFSGLNNYCEVMGMTGMTEKTHTSHVISIHSATYRFKGVLLADSVKRVREAHNSPTGILNLAVSFDGSWQKRGHTSSHGIGAVIEVQTGLILDYHVMATFCQLCSSTGTLKRKTREKLPMRFASHKDQCTINHKGSSGMMVKEASRVMWGRSLDKGLRYTTLVSDGDSKTFLELTKLDPYEGKEIVKEECTNHVARRLGSGLRNLVSSEAKKGNTLGGRLGALTQVAKSVRSVYDHLTSDALLSRCLGGLTQNANESFHAQVWMRCPKHLFTGRKRLEIALTTAAANFNSGSRGLHRILSEIGCKINGECVRRGWQRDLKRVLQAEQRQSSEAKRRRQAMSQAATKAQQEYETHEGGPSYASGAF